VVRRVGLVCPVLVLFTGLPPFTDSDSHGDIFSGTFPRQRGEGGGGVPMGGGQDFEPGSRTLVPQFTVATGYLALGLLGLTLLIGPANLLLRRRNPVSSYLRRDVGTWTAVASVAHVILGFQVHGGSGIFSFLDFFVADGRPLTNSFGLGNWTGLAALVIVAGLLALSTDGSLRELKARRWKNLQRLNYALFALVVVHAFFYGALLRTTSPFTLLLFFIVAAVFVGQAGGIWLWRRRNARTAASQRERKPAGPPG
jgi:sulfoxide reductase heme-binding subunit YedZ